MLIVQLRNSLANQRERHIQGLADPSALQRGFAAAEFPASIRTQVMGVEARERQAELVGQQAGEPEGVDPFTTADVVNARQFLDVGFFEHAREVGYQNGGGMALTIQPKVTVVGECVDNLFGKTGEFGEGGPAEGVGPDHECLGIGGQHGLLGLAEQTGFGAVAEAGPGFTMKHPGAGENGIGGNESEFGSPFAGGFGPFGRGAGPVAGAPIGTLFIP